MGMFNNLLSLLAVRSLSMSLATDERRPTDEMDVLVGVKSCKRETGRDSPSVCLTVSAVVKVACVSTDRRHAQPDRRPTVGQTRQADKETQR